MKKRPATILDYPEHTSDEERQAVAKYRSTAATTTDDDFLSALLADADAAIQPIHAMDPFTHWIKRILGETVYADTRIPPNPIHDSLAVLADKQIYVASVAGSFGFVPVSGNFTATASGLTTLIKEAKVLMPTHEALHFHPQDVAFAPPLAAAQVLHVAAHLTDYVRSAIIHCCRSQGGPKEVYLDKSYEELWVWLVGEGNKALPVSAWPAQSGLPFVDYMRGLWRIQCI